MAVFHDQHRIAPTGSLDLGEHSMPMNFSRLDRRASWGTGGRNWVRTSDPSLVRRTRTVARRRPPWPEVPSSMTNRRQMSLYAARRLPPLAPRLAPLNLVSRANWWY